MSLENTVGNILRGIAVASSLYMTGCGTTIRIRDPEKVWYDCNTNEDYPQGHPCYAEVEAYKARMATASASTASSGDDKITRDTRDNTTQKSGHYVCKRK